MNERGKEGAGVTDLKLTVPKIASLKLKCLYKPSINSYCDELSKVEIDMRTISYSEARQNLSATMMKACPDPH